MNKDFLEKLLDKDEKGEIKSFLITCIENEMLECFRQNYILSSGDLRDILKELVEEVCIEEKEKIKDTIRKRVLQELKEEFGDDTNER